MINMQYNTMDRVKERGIFHVTARLTSKRLSFVVRTASRHHRCRLIRFFVINANSFRKQRFGKIFTFVSSKN